MTFCAVVLGGVKLQTVVQELFIFCSSQQFVTDMLFWGVTVYAVNVIFFPDVKEGVAEEKTVSANGVMLAAAAMLVTKRTLIINEVTPKS